MRAVRLIATDPTSPRVEVREVVVPTPAPGEVLVRVHAAPIHPDDVLFCRGRHGFRRPLPTTPGLEGAGTVVAAHGGLIARGLVGRRVAFLSDGEREGSWAPYVAVPAWRCLPVWPGLDDARAALLLLAPCTALGLLDAVPGGPRAGIVVTAASGVIGGLVARIAAQSGRPVVAVVEGEARAARVRASGVPHVVDLSAPDGDAVLRREVRAVRAHAVIDAVGGEVAGRVLAALPDGAVLIHHRTLSGDAPRVDPDDLVYRGKTVSGFWVEDRLRRDGLRARMRWLPRIRALSEDLVIDAVHRIGLDDVPAALDDLPGGRGRLLIAP